MPNSKKIILGDVSKNYFHNLAYQFTSYLFPAIFVFALPNLISKSEFSLIASLLSYYTIVSVVTDFGIDLYAPKKIHESIKLGLEIDDFLHTIIIFKIALSIILIPILFFYVITIYPNKLIVLIMLGSTLPRSLNFYWWFLGNSKIIKYAFFTSIIWVLFLVIVIVLPFFYEINALIVACLFFLANLSISIYGVSSIIKFTEIKLFNRLRFDLKILKESFPYFSSRIASVSYTAFGIPILSHYNLHSDIAVYSISEQFYRLAQSFIAPLVLSSYMHYDPKKNVNLFNYLIVVVLFAILLYVLLIFLFPIILEFFPVGNLYKSAFNYFDFYSVAIIVHIFASFFGFPLSNLYGNSSYANKSILYAALFYFLVISVIVLFQILNIKTLIMSMIITEFFLFLLRFFHYQSKIKSIK